jgi:glucosylceramidase
MRLRRHVVVSILVVVVSSLLVAPTAGLPAAVPAAAAPPAAHVWVTTPDGAMKMSDRGAADFRPGGSDLLTISVDPTRRYQVMDGFGASITDSSAYVLSRLDGKTRAAAMRRLFSRTDGDGLSFLRQPMGASDFVAGGFYTYDDLPAGRTDYGMTRFSIAHDRAQILPLLRQALALNPQLKVIGSPWSAPAWMKTNQSLIGGRLIDEPRIYAAYARYFVEFVRAYERARVPVYAVTVQNEPQNRHPNGYPGTDMPVAQEAKLIEALGPALHAAGLHTKILGYDHNWSEHPADIASTPPGEDPETEYPTDLLNSSAGRWIAGTAFHCYSGDPSRQTALHDAFPDKGIWFTECSGSHGPSDPPAQVFSDTLKWHARNLVLGVTRNWGRTVVNWNLALDPAGGPHLGGCDTCSGVVTVGPGQTVTENAEYYTLGHLARFVRPGAVRIASTSFGTTGWNGQVMDAAFRNPDGSTALVVHNENDDPRSFAVAQGGASFAYTLPGGALATFTWPASPALNDGRVLLDAHGTTATASPPGDAGNAVDDDATTRWTTGAGQEPGQYLQVDLGSSQPVRRVVLDTGADAGDFPRGYALFTSADGVHWSDAPAASGAGGGQLTTIDVPATAARFLRVVQTQAAPQWWSVADLRVYR